MTDNNLDTLLIRFRDHGDPEALAELFDATAPRLLPLAMNFTHDPTDAEDLLQTTYLAMIESVDRYDPSRPVMGWLTGILTKKARHTARQERRSPDQERLRRPDAPAPDRAVEGAEIEGELHRAVARLPETYRVVVEPVLRQGLRPAEIAAKLGRAPGAVRTQLHRAVGMLRKSLPKGVALPAALIAFESTGMAAVRGAVLAEAAKSQGATLATATAAGAGKAAAVVGWAAAVLLIVGGSWWIIDREPEITPGPATTGTGGAKVSEREEAPQQHRQPSDRERFIEPIQTSALRSGPLTGLSVRDEKDAPGEVSRIETGEIVLLGYQGWSFVQGAAVDADRSDFYLDASDIKAGEGGGLKLLPDLEKRVDGRPCSADCYVRSVVRFEPDQVRWQSRNTYSWYWGKGSRTYLLKTPRGGWAVVGFLNSTYDQASGRHFETRLRYAYNPVEPVFRQGSAGGTWNDGVQQDADAFLSDPEGAALALKKAKALRALDRKVRQLQGDYPASKVRGVLSRVYTSTITRGQWAYENATFSFTHDTREDPDLKTTGNDWAFTVEGLVDELRIRTVTDDRSTLIDLGPCSLESFAPSDAAVREDQRKSPAEEGHTYLVHTLDRNSDRWDLLEVLEIVNRKWMIFRWKEVPAEQMAGLLESRRRPENEIRDLVRIQMRGGAGGGNPNRAYLDGSKNMYVDTMLPEPFDLSPPVQIGEQHRAWVDGGVVPFGHMWIVDRIEYDVTTKGDSNGPGGFRVVLGGKTIVEVKEGPEGVIDTWHGRVALRPRNAAQSYVEILNSSTCDVRLYGRMIQDRK